MVSALGRENVGSTVDSCPTGQLGPRSPSTGAVREFDPNGSVGVVVDPDGIDVRDGMVVAGLVGWLRLGSTGAGAGPVGVTGRPTEPGGAMAALVGAGAGPPPVVDEPLVAADGDTVA
jgi:hypothetical protein